MKHLKKTLHDTGRGPKWIFRIAPALFLAACLGLTACDSDGGSEEPEAVSFEGRVTDDAGYGKLAAAVEGAVVTAAALQADGTFMALEGEAMTDAAGAFTLEAEGPTNVVVLTATKDAFRSKALVYRGDGEETVRAMPMTTESKAEADVYAQLDAPEADVTLADVAVYVNARLAAALQAGEVTASEVAAAIETSEQADEGYRAADEEADENPGSIRSNEERAFAQFQADLDAAADAEAQNAAIAAFEQALVEAYTDAGVSLEAQAKARQASLAALLKFFNPTSAEARFALRQQAELLASMATARRIEANFEAEGASQDRLDALALAHTTLLASLRTASSESEIEVARDAYEASVEAEVVAELNIDAVVLATVETVLTTAKEALDASITTAGSAGDIAEAYAAFYTTAEASAETTLATSNNAELGAQVLTLLKTR